MQHPIPALTPTLVGSFPHKDPQRLLARILDRFPQMPAWPQMPARDWRESMYVQYSEGLPGVIIDRQEQRIYFRTDEAFQGELEDFYQAVVEEDVQRFAISEEYANGLHLFLDAIRNLDVQAPGWVKGQVTGPFSFAMTVTDENKRSMAYTPELYEVAVQGMAMKARWLARRLNQIADGVLVVLDEPYLCAFGSAFVNVSREDVIAAIGGAADAVHKEGVLVGLHCCGNTDWSLVLSTDIDVINFDAFEFFQGLSLYPTELKSFLDRGGLLSWGIVPVSEAVDDLNVDMLIGSMDQCVGQLTAKGIDRDQLYRQAILTPACGLGTQTEERADRVLDVLLELSAALRYREVLG
jgi:methionine synthase II (cobalamin-independent)